MKKKFVCSVLFCGLLAARFASADPLDTWTVLTNPVPYKIVELNGIAYGNGIFVALGGNNTLVTSTNGTNWTPQPSVTSTADPFRSGHAGETTTNSLQGIIFANGRFVAYGTGIGVDETSNQLPPIPLAVTSTNGLDWTGVELAEMGGEDELTAITYGNGEFIITDFVGPPDGPLTTYVQVAPDGIDWGEYGTTGLPTNTPVDGLTFGYVTNGTTATAQFAAITYGNIVYTSPDSFTWSASPYTFPTELGAITYANGLYIADGYNYSDSGAQDVLSSRDLVTWTPGTTADYDTPDTAAIAYGNGNVVAVGYAISSAAVSPVPLDWALRFIQPPGSAYSYAFQGVVYGNGLWVAVGSVGSTFWSTGPNTGQEVIPCIAVSGGLIHAASSSSGTKSGLHSIIESLLGDTLLAVGDNGTIVSSVNGGKNWTPPNITGLTTNILFGLTQTDSGQYIAVGDKGTISFSTDGKTWSSAVSGVTTPLTGVASGNGTNVAVGAGGEVLTSTTGMTWSRQAELDTNGLASIAFGNGMFEAIGNDGMVFQSADGVHWTTELLVLPPSTGTFGSLTFGGGQFTAVDNNGNVLTSSNGLVFVPLFAGLGAGASNNPTSAIVISNTLVLVGTGGNISTVEFPVAGTGTDNSLNGVVYNGQIYVAVGDSGTIIKSPDAIAWTTPTNYFDTPNRLYAVTYGNGQFVGVGGSSWVVASPDGDNWSSQSTGVSSTDLNAIAFGDGTFVAVGGQGTILASVDGVNWNVETNGTGDNLDAVTFAGGQFVAIGDQQSSTSPDGTNWTVGVQGQSGIGGLVSSVCGGNGIYVAVNYYGVIYTSPDGLNWAAQAEPNVDLYSVTFGGGLFIATSTQGAAYASPNGTNWTELQTDDGGWDLYAAAAGNSEFVLVGENGTSVSAAYSALVSLPGATLWNTINGPDGSFQAVGYNGKSFVTVGGSTSTADLVSLDGLNWINEGVGLEGLANAITWGNGIWVVCDYYGNVFTSTNSTNWTQRAGTSLDLLSVAYGGGVYVIGAANGVTVTSTDGIHWSPHHTSFPGDVNAVTFAQGQFVAVDSDGSAGTSVNGISWTTNMTPATRSLRGITYGGGLYVAVGDDSSIVTSPDGLNWTLVTDSPTTDNSLVSVAWGGNQFMAVGENGWVEKSADGITWVSTSSATVNNLNSVIYANGGFLAVGDDGTILETKMMTPSQFTGVSYAPTEGVVLNFSGAPGMSYQIQFSSDLVNWYPLGTVNMGSGGAAQFIDSSQSTTIILRPIITPLGSAYQRKPARFYRAVLLP